MRVANGLEDHGAAGQLIRRGHPKHASLGEWYLPLTYRQVHAKRWIQMELYQAVPELVPRSAGKLPLELVGYLRNNMTKKDQTDSIPDELRLFVGRKDEPTLPNISVFLEEAIR